MIVVDSNVLAYFWIRGEMTPLAEAAFRKDSDWASTTLWRSEFRNVLVGYLRRKELTMEQALRAFEGAAAQIGERELAVPTNQVLYYAQQSTCSAYDCEFVALAEQLGVTLVTCDSQILRDLPLRAVHLKDFVK